MCREDESKNVREKGKRFHYDFIDAEESGTPKKNKYLNQLFTKY